MAMPIRCVGAGSRLKRDAWREGLSPALRGWALAPSPPFHTTNPSRSLHRSVQEKRTQKRWYAHDRAPPHPQAKASASMRHCVMQACSAQPWAIPRHGRRGWQSCVPRSGSTSPTSSARCSARLRADAIHPAARSGSYWAVVRSTQRQNPNGCCHQRLHSPNRAASPRTRRRLDMDSPRPPVRRRPAWRSTMWWASCEASPILRQQINVVTQDEVRLKGNIVIGVHSGSYRTIRGRSLLAVVGDETPYWRSEFCRADVEIFRACAPALAASGGIWVGI